MGSDTEGLTTYTCLTTVSPHRNTVHCGELRSDKPGDEIRPVACFMIEGLGCC
jgi:hypothetical protein